MYGIRKLLLVVIGIAAIDAFAFAAGSDPHPKLNSSDHSFLTDALASNQLEIDVSAYAVKQAKSDKVRAFAKTMVAEHAKLAIEMQKANDGLVPTPPPTPQPGINLLGRNGAEFDDSYVALMVSYEDEELGKFGGAVDGPQHTPIVHDMAKKLLPMIRHHDAAANALERALRS